MQRIIGVLVVLATPLLLAAHTDDDVQKELKALQGKWKTVALEAAGTPFPKGAMLDFTMVIAADGKASGDSSQDEFQFTITVDPKKNPKTIDNLHESGSQKGTKQYGIYKLEGDKFTVCMAPRGAAQSARPKDFSTKDNRNVLFVFERVKADK